MAFTRYNGNWVFAETYQNFVVYRILKDENFKVISKSNKLMKDFYTDCSTKQSVQNLLELDYGVQPYFDIDAMCIFIQHPGIYGLYENGTLGEPKKLYRHGNMIDEAVISANLFADTNEGVGAQYDIFKPGDRLRIKEFIKSNPNYEIVLTKSEWILDVSGKYSSASIFDLENLDKIAIDLNTKKYHKAVIHQRADGINYTTQLRENQSEIQTFYPKHLIATIYYWFKHSRDELFPNVTYLYFSKPLLNCSLSF